MNLPKHSKYEMYYAVYPDGVKSADFYNLTRAKEHTATIDSTMPLRASRKLTDAFK